MVINGGALGLLHRELPANLRAPARYWLTGTLLIAIGGLAYALQHLLPLPLMVVLANGGIMLGVTTYWHSLRRFLGLRGNALVLLGSLHTLHQHRKRGYSRSRQVLTAIYLLLLALVMLRTAYLVFIANIAPDHSIVSPSWMNLLTPMVSALLPVAGTTVFILMCHEHLRRQWEQAASTDFLTGLANRRCLSDIARQRLEACRRGESSLAIALIDIDHFKQINDQHGHEAGDQALRL
jgi:GGDEF domain-containing protein